MWSYHTGHSAGHTHGAISSSFTLDSAGNLYIGSNDHNLYAFNGLTGALLWNFEANSEVWSAPAISESAGLVFFMSRLDANLYAVRLADGHLVWEYSIGHKCYGSPMLAHGMVYLGADDGDVHGVNQNHGHVADVGVAAQHRVRDR